MTAQEATPDPDDSIWGDDRLGRSADAAFLKSFLLGRVEERRSAGLTASYVLNIDADWGQGKSFFLSRFGQMLKADGYLVAQVNAWQDDHAEDPLLAVMDAMDEAVAPLVKREKTARSRWQTTKETGGAIAVAAAKGATVVLAKKLLGAGVDEIATIVTDGPASGADKAIDDASKSLGDMVGAQGKKLLESFREGKRTISKFRSNLREFLKVAKEKGQPLPLFVLIDELDRCRPPFAIALLERIKHLFEIDQVVFVVATDTRQLSHSVGAVYGAGFNSEGYLARFFNRTYSFEKTSRREFIDELLERSPINDAKISLPPTADLGRFLADGFYYFNLPLRDIEQTYDIIRSVVTVWKSQLKIEMVTLFPLAVAHQQRFDLPISSAFHDALARLLKKLNGGDTPWQAPLYADDYQRTVHLAHINVLAAQMVQQSLTPLPNLPSEPGTPEAKWIVRRLTEEYALEHRNSFSGGVRPYSIIRMYPEIIKSAGRLVPAPK